jgi:hypothetical protein
LAVQVEVALEYFLRQSPASNRVAESLADLVLAMADQRPLGIIMRQRPGAFDDLVNAELLQGLVQAAEQLPAGPHDGRWERDIVPIRQ